MNAKTDEIVYFTVYAPGGNLLGNFRSREKAESFAAYERVRRVAEIEDSRADNLVTQGEYRGAINFATYGITVRTMSLVFEDSLIQ